MNLLINRIQQQITRIFILIILTIFSLSMYANDGAFYNNFNNKA